MSHGASIIIEAWNTILFDKFVRFKHLLIDGLSGDALHPDSRPGSYSAPPRADCEPASSSEEDQ